MKILLLGLIILVMFVLNNIKTFAKIADKLKEESIKKAVTKPAPLIPVVTRREVKSIITPIIAPLIKPIT